MKQKNLNYLFTIIILLLGCSNCFANDSSNYIISYSQIGIEQGLAGKQANCGIQDSHGFIWIGTSQGLQRYDGKNFKTFTKEKSGLQDNVVSAIFEDQEEQLWIMYGLDGGNPFPTGGKVDILNLKTNEIKSITKKFGKNLPFDEKKIGFIYSNEKHQLLLLIRTNEGLPWQSNLYKIYNYSKNTNFEKQLDIQVYSYPFLIYRGDNIVVKEKDKTILYQLSNKHITPITYEDGSDFSNPFFLDVNNNLINITTTISQQSEFLSIPLPFIENKNSNSKIKKIANSKQTIELFYNIYDVYSASAIIQINAKKIQLLKDGKINTILSEKDWPKEFNLRIFGYFTSSDKQHWICTTNGVYKVKLTKNKFEHLLSSDNYIYPSKNHYQTRNIIPDNQNGYFIHSWGGTYQVKRRENGSWNIKTIAQGFSTDGTYFDGKKLISSYKRTERLYDSILKKTKTINEVDVPIWLGIQAKNKAQILGAYYKIMIQDSPADTIRSATFCDGTSLPDSWIQQFYYSSDGTLWAVGNAGLFQLNKNNCVEAFYNAETKNSKYRLPTSNINAIYEDKQGTFWLATAELGLIEWNRKKNTFLIFNTESGLSTNTLYAILEDDYGYLWISSDNGLNRFQPSTRKIKIYSTADGLTNDEFNRNSFLKGYNGEMLFGGLDGVNVFAPKDLLEDTIDNNPSLNIVSFFQFGKKTNQLLEKTDLLLQNKMITVKPGDDFFTLEFQLQDYNDGITKYAYMIEGIDKEWIYIKESSIRVAGLPYGNYTLKIKGRNNQDSWSNKELSIPITVVTPLLKKIWFQILLFLGLLGLIYLLFRYRTLQLGRDKETLEKTVAIRTLELNTSLQQKEVLLKEIHHRVKNNLAVVAGLLDMQANSTSNFEAKAIMQESQNRVAAIALIHQRLYQNKDMSAIEIKGFVEDMYGQIGTVFSRANMNVKVNFLLPNMVLDIDTAIPLGLIINELFTNSFKYAFTEGKEGLITIDIKEKRKGQYQLIYKDNGQGLPPGFDLSKTKTLGVRLVNLLSKQLSGEATYRYEQEQSIFIINFKDGNTRNNE